MSVKLDMITQLSVNEGQNIVIIIIIMWTKSSKPKIATLKTTPTCAYGMAIHVV